jgi:uncharacterized protein (TIGR04255 family)
VAEPTFPKRIYPDALIEAIVEFRLDTPEFAEIVVGRLLDVPSWAEFQRIRLPIADIPQPVRDVDIGLRYQPSIELRDQSGARVVKIGSHVLSYHAVGTYPGWAALSEEIYDALEQVVKRVPAVTFPRIGFRYINVFRSEQHHVRGIEDLQLTVSVGGLAVHSSVNINYVLSNESDHIVTVRIATPDLVQGPIANEYSVYCDIDVASRGGLTLSGVDQARNWVDQAHMIEKAEFFKILGPELTDRLSRPEGGSL